MGGQGEHAGSHGTGRGLVTFIGAGPGDPGLITVRGRQAAIRADAIIHDDLVDQRLLAKLGPGERHSLHETDAASRLTRLGELYATFADRGLAVARLKGGDPMMFARITEELALLRDLAIPYRIIPGVTAAAAAAAYAELPLTRRGSGRSVAFATGHGPLGTGGARFPVADTLCLYMGGGRSEDLCRELLSTGWPEDTPLTAVARISLPEQEVLHTTVEAVVSGRTKVPVGPVLAVVGVGAEPLASPAWFTLGPRILVTGTSAEPYLAYGEVVHTPLIESQLPEDPAPLAESAARLADFSWIAFTSGAGVDALSGAVRARGGDARSFAGVGLAAIGESTAAALHSHGLTADLIATVESGEGLAAAILAEIRRRRGESAPWVLHPRSDLATETFADRLRVGGCEVESVTAYVTRLPPPERLMRVELAGIDAVAFASPSAVRNFVVVYGTDLPAGLALVARGELTAAAIADLLGRTDALAIEQLAGLSIEPVALSR